MIIKYIHAYPQILGTNGLVVVVVIKVYSYLIVCADLYGRVISVMCATGGAMMMGVMVHILNCFILFQWPQFLILVMYVVIMQLCCSDPGSTRTAVCSQDL